MGEITSGDVGRTRGKLGNHELKASDLQNFQWLSEISKKTKPNLLKVYDKFLTNQDACSNYPNTDKCLKIWRFRSHHCVRRPKNLFKITRVDYDHQPHSMQVKKQTKKNSVISILSFSSRYYPLEVIISRQETSAFSFFVLNSCSEIRPLFFPLCFTVGYHFIINTSSLKKKKRKSPSPNLKNPSPNLKSILELIYVFICFFHWWYFVAIDQWNLISTALVGWVQCSEMPNVFGVNDWCVERNCIWLIFDFRTLICSGRHCVIVVIHKRARTGGVSRFRV